MTKPYLFLIFAIYLTTVEKGEGATTLSKLLKASKTDTSQKKSIHNSRYLVRDYGMVVDEQSVLKDVVVWDYFKENMPPWYVFLYHPKYRQVTATERNVKIPNTKRWLSTLFGGKRVFQILESVGPNSFTGDKSRIPWKAQFVAYFGEDTNATSGKMFNFRHMPSPNNDWVQKRDGYITEAPLTIKINKDKGIFNDLEEANLDDYYDYVYDTKITNGRYTDFKKDGHSFRIELYYR